MATWYLLFSTFYCLNVFVILRFFNPKTTNYTQDKAFREIETSFSSHFDTLLNLKKILMDDLNPDPMPTTASLEEMRAAAKTSDR